MENRVKETKAELEYLLLRREELEQELSYLACSIDSLRNQGKIEEMVMQRDGYYAAQRRLDIVNDSIDSCHAFIQQFDK